MCVINFGQKLKISGKKKHGLMYVINFGQKMKIPEKKENMDQCV